MSQYCSKLCPPRITCWLALLIAVSSLLLAVIHGKVGVSQSKEMFHFHLSFHLLASDAMQFQML